MAFLTTRREVEDYETRKRTGFESDSKRRRD